MTSESESKTATCCGSPICCPICKGPTEHRRDSYGGLAGGGDYEVFGCLDPKCSQGAIYVELPD